MYPKLVKPDPVEEEERLRLVESSKPSGPPPEPPANLRFEAKCEWLASAPELHKSGRLIGGVLSLFELYCVAVGHARDYEKMLQNDGSIIGGKPHPAYKMMLDAMSHAKALGAEIGFVKKVVVSFEKPPAEKSDWDDDKSLLA